MSFSELIKKVYNNIYEFNNNKILLLFDKNNMIWMSYNNILDALGYNIKQKQRNELDDKYFNTYENIYSQSKLNKINLKNQQPHETLINESGIYLLLSKSNKNIAKELSKKLFTEVLPELRQKGKYIFNTTERRKMNKVSQKIKLYQREIKRTSKKNYTFENNTGNGFIYVISIKTFMNGKHKTCYKIGYTANLEKRIATYKTGNPDVKLSYQENLKCNKKQLEKCVLNLNTLKLLKNNIEIICDVPLEKIIKEIKDCKTLLKEHSNVSLTRGSSTRGSS